LPELRKKTSHRNMSEIDKLSWLVLGRASKGLGHTDTALLQRAALALLTRGRWWDE
jgi:translocation and assembly module TamB